MTFCPNGGIQKDAATDDRIHAATNGHGDGHTLSYTNSSATTTPELIAICGLALRLPGGIKDADTFWNVLYNGLDTRMPIPSSRFNVDGFNGSRGKKGVIETKHGYFLEEDIFSLDTSFFLIPKQELEKMDPQQRQLLEVTRECLENAGEVNYRGKDIGCYVGTFGDEWLHAMSKESQPTARYNFGGDLMIANRVSYEYDFKGPSLVIKTGCSASLVALHEACRALQSGDCTSAVVAGTSIITGPMTYAAETEHGILSPDGSCKTFDEAANGYARGEAINAVYIKTLKDAVRDSNPIRAIIRNTGTNSDGRKGGLELPSSKAHESLMRKIYADAGLNPVETAFVECHGTGTAAGDPIETTAIGNVFGEAGVLIGSVKPNVGHSEGASGITSLIKAVLALEHEIIPPNIKFSKPNPKIPFQEKKLSVPVKPTAWPEGRAARISINSFGIAGSNAHVIVDSAASHVQSLSKPSTMTRRSGEAHLLIFSANSPRSLERLIDDMKVYLRSHPDRLADLSYTLSQRRQPLTYRAFAVAKDDRLENISAISKVPGNVPTIAMVFTGQGAQWAGMGRELLKYNFGFLKDILAMDEVLRSLKFPPEWSIYDELHKTEHESQINKGEIAQPVSTAVQIALVNAVTCCGIKPSAVIGHSSGEIAAAFAAGALSMPEAIILAYYRGYVTKSNRLRGGMASIGLPSEEVARYLQDGVVVACENSPSSTTISGNADILLKVVNTIKGAHPDVLVRQLKVDVAYHSSHMNPLRSRYVNLVVDELLTKGLQRSNTKIPFFSSVRNEVLEKPFDFSPEYWGGNLTSPVLFQSAVNTLLNIKSQSVFFLEIGPHSALSGPLRQICAEMGTQCLYAPTMVRNHDCIESILSAYGKLQQYGVEIDSNAFSAPGTVLTDLPPYPWDHSESFCYPNRIYDDWRFRPVGHHALLGQRIPESTTINPAWRVVLDLEDEPWLSDHKLRDDIVFPFTGYVSMAGEAIRQITGVETGYSVRHVLVHTAIVLTESKPVEMVTTLRRCKLTDKTESEDYDFLISSFSGSTWIKNCEGRVKPLNRMRESTSLSSLSDVLPREINPAHWYNTMNRVGNVYGPEFQGITALCSSTTKHLVKGQVTSSEVHQNAPFLFHPADMDSCIQLGSAVMAQGAGKNLTQLFVPTLIEELDITQSSMVMDVRAWGTQEGKNISMDCEAEGQILLRIRGMRVAPLEDGSATAVVDRHAAARLQWYPDFDFLDGVSLFTPPAASTGDKILLEELLLLCLLDSAERLEGLETSQGHFLKFRDWLHHEVNRARFGTYPIIKGAADYVEISRPVRLEMIADRAQKLAHVPGINSAMKGIMRIHDNAEELFTGAVDTLELLMEDNLLTDIHKAVSFRFNDFVHKLAIMKPNIRILEVGAGTGGTTELILRDLIKPGGHPPYSKYTFTDISAGFFHQATERFAYAPNMEMKVFDISKEPFEQGFEAQSYDLIIASNVVHATPNLQATLKNLWHLLHPEGHIVLSEFCGVARVPNYIFGNFSGWWLGETDNRKYEPYVQVDRWDQELKAADFTGVNYFMLDHSEPYNYCVAIVSQPDLGKTTPSVRAVTVFCDAPEEGASSCLITNLERSGFDVDTRTLGDPLPEDRNIICIFDLERPFFENITKKRFEDFQKFLRSYNKRYRSKKLLWLMPPTQAHCINPRYSQTIGMFRDIRAELALDFCTLEINPDEIAFSDLVIKVYQKVCTREDIDKVEPDKEYIVDNGLIKIPRYEPFSLQQELNVKNTTHQANLVKTLEISKPGLLESLQWVESRRPLDIGHDKVEIAPCAVGLNFYDIVAAMGFHSYGDQRPPVGIELAGVVLKVGKNVTHVKPGDRVCGVAPGGCFTTNAVLDNSLVAKIPDSLTFIQAATMPIVFATVIESLINVGELERGQTVLIHSAAGAVGHAAIQICQMIGAEVFLTCGSEHKVEYLCTKFGIPRDRIFNSRDASFLDDVLRMTNGRGVDIVLNSLSGELLHASWKCVAEFGKLIELGKRDLNDFGKLDLEPFLLNRSYCGVNLAHIMEVRPAAVEKLMRSMLDMYRFGIIEPIHEVTLFDASKVEQCFRHLQRGDSIGKAVVVMPDNISDIPSVARETLKFDSSASYLITGGLGGIGRSVATWMVDRGAKELILFSRRAGQTDRDEKFIAELESMGCSARAVAGEVCDRESVQNAISTAAKPVKGVIHLAAVFQDAPVLDLTYEQWIKTIAPKVDGAWNLHHAFVDVQLDFFFMASSVVSVQSLPNQASYAAANTFLESFCQYRNSLGLPASVLNICAIVDVGVVSENHDVARKLKSQGAYFLSEPELLEYIELSILNSYVSTGPMENLASVSQSWANPAHIIMGLRSEVHLDDPDCQTTWRRDRRMGTYHNIRDEVTNDQSANSNRLKGFVARAADEPEILRDQASIDFLAFEIGKKIFKFMIKDEEDVQISLTLAQVGLDSLLAIELRRWWKQTFGVDISVLEIMASGTIEELGKVAARCLREKLTGKP